jgi:recombination associated protein RdgC
MWFKQAQLFQLTSSMRYTSTTLIEKLEKLIFQDCLPSMPYSAGWISPVDEEDAPLIQTMNGYVMVCLQIEEKILPPSVVRHEIAKKIKNIEEPENRKVGHKERYALKDEITATLLPRAFSKLTKVYAYIDTKNKWLVLGTANPKKTEQFISSFKKTFGDNIDSFQIKKLSAIMTSWLKHQNYSSSFSIEKSCVLQDANHQGRVIRCKDQDLFASSIQAFIKDGCEIKQLALNWQDRIDFVLIDDLSIQSIGFQDEIIEQVKQMEAGTKQQQFNADFLMMTETLGGLLKDLLDSFADQSVKINSGNVVSIAKLA